MRVFNACAAIVILFLLAHGLSSAKTKVDRIAVLEQRVEKLEAEIQMMDGAINDAINGVIAPRLDYLKQHVDALEALEQRDRVLQDGGGVADAKRR